MGTNGSDKPLRKTTTSWFATLAAALLAASQVPELSEHTGLLVALAGLAGALSQMGMRRAVGKSGPTE